MEYIEELIFEVSKYRSDVLKEIDQNFAQIKKDKKDLAVKKQLVENIKKFSGVKNIILSFKKDYMNAAVIPIYNQTLSADLINLFKDYKAETNIKNIQIIEEPATYIEKLYIIFGMEIIDMFSPRELTAILLHELGHSFTYTSNLPRIFLALIQKSFGIAGTLLRFPILWAFNLISFPAYVVSSLIIILVTRSLTFLEHKSEYKADQFAAKYGYFDEMIKVLYKLHNKEVEIKSKQSLFEKLLEFMKMIFTPSNHPPSSERIKELNNTMLVNYKKLYPKLSNELNIILKDVENY